MVFRLSSYASNNGKHFQEAYERFGISHYDWKPIGEKLPPNAELLKVVLY